MLKRFSVFVFLCIAFSVNRQYISYAQEALLLQIVHYKTDVVLHEWKVKPGDRFYLDYTHSSAKTPVHDIFIINDQGQIILIEENFSWFGAGLEALSTEHSRVVYDTRQKKIRVLQHRHFPDFLLRIGRVANHRMTCHKKSIPLKNLAKGGELVRIQVTQTSHVRKSLNRDN